MKPKQKLIYSGYKGYIMKGGAFRARKCGNICAYSEIAALGYVTVALMI